MIKIENVEVYGWEAAIRGMRNPLNSWKLSDSVPGKDGFFVGKNDYGLMERLVSAGSDHGKFMRYITVTADITAPLYWYKEWDTYKVGTVANSCSTMHKIHAKEFTLEDFSHEHMTDGCIDMMNEVVHELNFQRDAFMCSKDKQYWWNMIQLLPSSYNQKRTVLLNYEVLRHMYRARKAHKLDEWRDLCEWIKTLPYHELITMEG